MSDENVGGLVEKWRHEDPPHGYDCNCDRCRTFEQCASELEAALSAHGQPVVDAAMIERAKGPLPTKTGDPDMWSRGFDDAVQLVWDELPAALTAALAGAGHE